MKNILFTIATISLLSPFAKAIPSISLEEALLLIKNGQASEVEIKVIIETYMQMISPQEQTDLKLIELYAESVRSPKSEIRNSAADSLITIASQTKSAKVQEALLTKVTANWNYYNGNQGDYGQTYLEKLVRMATSISPVNTHIQEHRIKFLKDALLSNANWIRNLAGESLCTVAVCGKHSNQSQLTLIKELEGVNWNFYNGSQTNYGQTYLEKVIEALQILTPINSEVQVARVEALAKAVISSTNYIRNTAADALISIAQRERDFVTQKALLEKVDVDWDYYNGSQPNYGQTFLEKLIEMASDIHPATPQIQELKIKFLKKALVSRTNHIRVRASESFCSIAECKMKTERTQISFIQELKDINWDYYNSSQTNYGQTYLEKSVLALKKMEPITDEVQNERIIALSKALISSINYIRSESAEALSEIASKYQDYSTQKSLLENVIVNWNYFNSSQVNDGRSYLYEILNAIELIRPSTQSIQMMKIEFLEKAMHSSIKSVSQRALEVLEKTRWHRFPTVEESVIDVRIIVKIEEAQKTNTQDEVMEILAELEAARRRGQSIDVDKLLNRLNKQQSGAGAFCSRVFTF